MPPNLRSLTKSDRVVETTAKTTAESIAVPHPSTRNPVTTTAASLSITAFTTKVKSPKVRKFIGADIKSKTGLIKVFKTPIIIAAKIKAWGPEIPNPGTKYAVAIKDKALSTKAINRYKEDHPLSNLL